MKKLSLSLLLILVSFLSGALAQTAKAPRFKVLVLAQNGGHHAEYTKAAMPWLDKLAADSNFTYDLFRNTNTFTDDMLKQYQLILQLDYAPYAWKEVPAAAFLKYIDEGRGAWIGFHHATLLGDFDGFKMWPWFSDWMGHIKYKNYIADFASAVVNVEDKKSPIMKGVPPAFPIITEEWYTYDKSPRLDKNIHVLATVDESTYIPSRDIKMGGDHPVIWTNTKKPGKNLYIFMGHSPDLFNNPSYTTLLRNAIFWSVSKKK